MQLIVDARVGTPLVSSVLVVARPPAALAQRSGATWPVVSALVAASKSEATITTEKTGRTTRRPSAPKGISGAPTRLALVEEDASLVSR